MGTVSPSESSTQSTTIASPTLSPTPTVAPTESWTAPFPTQPLVSTTQFPVPPTETEGEIERETVVFQTIAPTEFEGEATEFSPSSPTEGEGEGHATEFSQEDS